MLCNIYGLNQSLHMWYECFNEYLLQVGFKNKKSYSNVYIEHFIHMFIILGFYVDGSISVSSNIPFLNIANMELFQAFDVTNNGEFHYYLDIQVHWNRPNKTNHINQEKYILEKL